MMSRAGVVGTLVVPGGDLQSGFVGLKITRNTSHEQNHRGAGIRKINQIRDTL